MLIRAPAALTLKETSPPRETNATDPSQNNPINQECSGIIVKQAKRLFSALTLRRGGLADRSVLRRLNQDLSNYCLTKLNPCLCLVKTYGDTDVGIHVPWLTLPSQPNYHG